MTNAKRLANPIEDIPNAPSVVPAEQLEASLVMAKAAARAAAENKGQDIVLLDVSNQTSIFDCFVIATGTSRRQLHAISDEIDHALEAMANDV